MASRQEVGITIETDPPLSSGNDNDRRRSSVSFLSSTMHSRSASWSFTGTTRPNASDISSGLASINPIRSVIREFVPSLNPQQENTSTPPSRSNSQISLGRLSIPMEDNGSSRTFGTNHLSHTSPSTMSREGSEHSLEFDNAREQPYADIQGTLYNNMIQQTNATATDDNVELSDWVRWVEQNLVFIMVLAVRYAWIHGLGMRILTI